jgi:hypothetical protein
MIKEVKSRQGGIKAKKEGSGVLSAFYPRDYKIHPVINFTMPNDTFY